MSVIDPIRRAITAAGPLVILALAGCASYEPAPVDPAARYDDWLALDPGTVTTTVAEAFPSTPGRVGSSPPPGFDLTDGISLAEAETVALFFHPDLQRLRATVGIERAGAAAAGAWEDPELGIDAEYILDNVPDRWLYGGTLSVTIPLSGRPAVERRLAAAQVTEAEAIVLGAEWALLAELKRDWVAYAALVAETALLDRTIADLDRLVAASERFKAARAITVVDERLLLLERAHARDERLDVEGRIATMRLAILARLGLHPSHDWRLTAELPAVDLDAPVESPDFTAALGHPQLATVLAAYAVAERALELETRRTIPDLRVGFGAGEEDGDSRLLFGLGLIPIPVWNRNRAGIARADATREAAAVEIEGIVRELVHRLARERTRHEAARTRLAFLEREVAPLADAQQDDARRLTSLGQLDLFLLVDALAESRRVRRELLEARATVLDARIALAACVGPFPELPAGSSPSNDASETPR